MSENYTLGKKDIKHARIKVSEDGHVRVLVPYSFTDDDISALISKKSNWISKQLAFFEKKSRIELNRNQILLFGNRYSYFYDDTYSRKIVIDHSFKTVRSKKNLLDPEIQKNWYKKEARKYLVPRTEELAKRLNFTFKRIYIRDQRTKLGNCSAEGNISLNWRLVKAPTIVSDYIIIHELVHTKIMNHSSKFWTLLKSLFPDYKDAMNWLDKYGNSL
ncbi:M48 family metallopeptidase [Priestia megaterium]|uniref:M48 family metallopeptidase n=1 Tax=Priestia megaterium TaxID=1404 RepID=UPI001C3F36D1|nr:SprT family zinc-dependent metalloprotease [Priestia megaterium]